MHRGVYIVFKWFYSTHPDGLLCMHSHQCITALSGKLVLLQDTFLVAALTFLSRAVGQSARKPHKAILPHETIWNTAGWLSGHVSRPCSGSLHLTPHMRPWLKVISKNCVCPFSLCWCKDMQMSFPWKKQIDCFSLHYASALNVSLSHFLIICVELNGRKSLSVLSCFNTGL